MSAPNTVRSVRSFASVRRANSLDTTLPGIQVDVIGRLEGALQDIAHRTSRALGEPSSRSPYNRIPRSVQRAVTRSQTFERGVNIRRGSEFNEEEIDFSLFERRDEMAEANAEAAPVANEGLAARNNEASERIVNDEIQRLMHLTPTVGNGTLNQAGHRQEFFPRRTTLNVGRNIHDWDWDPSVLESRREGENRNLPRFADPSTRREGNFAAPNGITASDRDELQRRIQRLAEEVAELREQPRRGDRHFGARGNSELSARAWTLEPGEALKLIRNFDGNDPSKLKGFLRSVEAAFGKVEQRHHADLLEFVLSSKLDDRAMRETEHKTIETVKQLRDELEALYGKQKSLAALQIEFNSLRQEPSEAISVYAARAEQITMEVTEKLCEIVNTDIEARAVEKVIRKCGQMNFENGLHGQVQTLVRSRNYYTLHESVNGAIEISKMVQTGTAKSDNSHPPTRSTLPTDAFAERKCFLCNKPGHIARDCPSAKERRSLPVRLPVPTRKSVNTVDESCHFCLEMPTERANPQRDTVDIRKDSSSDKTSGSSNGEKKIRTLGMLKINTITVLPKSRKRSKDRREPPQGIWAADVNQNQQQKKKATTTEKYSDGRLASDHQRSRVVGPSGKREDIVKHRVCSACGKRERATGKRGSEKPMFKMREEREREGPKNRIVSEKCFNWK